jgi:hypothetical protein
MSAADLQDNSLSRTFLTSGKMFTCSGSNQDKGLALTVGKSGSASDLAEFCTEEAILDTGSSTVGAAI